MELLNDSFHLHKMGQTPYHAQYRRQRISADWQPRGYERYRYQKALQDQMPVLGGASDGLLSSPERYTPVSECNETLDCTCKGVHG